MNVINFQQKAHTYILDGTKVGKIYDNTHEKREEFCYNFSTTGMKASMPHPSWCHSALPAASP